MEYIGGRANFNHSKITSPGKLKYIGKKLRLDATELKASDFASVEVKGEIITEV